jgi:RecA/RadA recombinase
MTNKFVHSIIRTPIDTLNIIGAGGINQSTITELWGPPGSGKSAFAYETAANFLQDNPTGRVKIIDPELSVDMIRLEFSFRLDMSRVDHVNAGTLEAGYAEIYKTIKLMSDQLADKKRKEPPDPVLIIWDTIAASKPNLEVQAALEGKDPMNAGGMGLKARVNEINLAITMSSMWEKPVTIFLLNQVRTAGFGDYQGPHDTSTGGNALKHAGHYRFSFRKAKKIFDEKLMMNIGMQARVDIEKSKFGPTVQNIPIFIDDRSGGRIISQDEAASVLWQMGILSHTGGPWYKFKGDEESYTWDKSTLSEKSGRWVTGNPQTREKCLDILARHFRMNYYTLDIVYEKLGISLGKLNDTEKVERENLISKFSFTRPIGQDEGRDSTNA